MSIPRSSRAQAESTLRNERIEAALTRAVAEGDTHDLFDQLSRNSGLPGPRPNLDLARVVGLTIARHGARATPVLRELAADESEFPRIVAAMSYAARKIAGFDAKGAMAGLQDLAEDPRHAVRRGLVEALRTLLLAKGEPVIDELAAWTDGYLQAHVVLEALSERSILDALHNAEPVLARLDEAFKLADKSPRAAERSQGVRVLRESLPNEIAAFAARFPETIAWLEGAAKIQRPESRKIVDDAIRALRKDKISDAEAKRLGDLLVASARPDRNAAKIVPGTRKRSKGRR
jgi:hypothetical protein